MALTEDAKAALSDAIRIVREDRFEKHARGVLSGYVPKTDAPKVDPIDPNNPPKTDPPNDPPKPRARGYWGELTAEDE